MNIPFTQLQEGPIPCSDACWRTLWPCLAREGEGEVEEWGRGEEKIHVMGREWNEDEEYVRGINIISKNDAKYTRHCPRKEYQKKRKK